MSTAATESGLYILHGKPQKPKRRAKFAALAVVVPVGFIAGALLGAGTVRLWTREAPTPAPIEAPLAIPHAEVTPPAPVPSPHALMNQWWQTRRHDPAPFQAKGESRRLPPQSPRVPFRNGRDA